MLTQPTRRKGRPASPQARKPASQQASQARRRPLRRTDHGRPRALALRAGPVERTGLRERLGGAADHAVNSLRRQGLIVVHNEYAHITRDGLRQCPSRRPGPPPQDGRQGVPKRSHPAQAADHGAAPAPQAATDQNG